MKVKLKIKDVCMITECGHTDTLNQYIIDLYNDRIFEVMESTWKNWFFTHDNFGFNLHKNWLKFLDNKNNEVVINKYVRKLNLINI